ncbi:MAG: hypothetical protein RLZZ455_1039 [Candidatus Parcubacteria bacterium]|jgi:predicted 3-demethylubiquinone-9 3-methyltransferase (glyoxalase superfamily)
MADLKQKITPFLWFDKSAEEAMNFYVDTFNNAPYSVKNSKIISVKRYPEGMEEEHMKGMGGKVLTGVFTLNGQQFMALDGGPLFKFSEAVSLLVDCKDQVEINYFWETFIKDGGEESQCGWLKDKFGFSWQIAPDMEQFLNGSDNEGSRRAMQAMFQMKKIDIASLAKAYEGK